MGLPFYWATNHVTNKILIKIKNTAGYGAVYLEPSGEEQRQDGPKEAFFDYRARPG